ncbi:hypothetical protein [Desulfuromonas sp. AOP6]|uniref:hypothetical protein n=1 Tax=Desulfuromonas sp. AOP6 TaxID=1566351 RepID=UPI00127AB697|nr:hypothetical protein [Desulfuromonas sp. AOP6]BCA81128.1 hypothetical protein AOP6_2915 [Desulfuromonas sp. AOP6]
MFFIPLSQVESVELVVHALRVAGGEADCTTCPARRVCMKQCLSIATSIETMIQTKTLPFLGEEEDGEPQEEKTSAGEEKNGDKGGHLKRIK